MNSFREKATKIWAATQAVTHVMSTVCMAVLTIVLVVVTTLWVINLHKMVDNTIYWTGEFFCSSLPSKHESARNPPLSFKFDPATGEGSVDLNAVEVGMRAIDLAHAACGMVRHSSHSEVERIYWETMGQVEGTSHCTPEDSVEIVRFPLRDDMDATRAHGEGTAIDILPEGSSAYKATEIPETVWGTCWQELTKGMRAAGACTPHKTPDGASYAPWHWEGPSSPACKALKKE